MRRLWIAVIMPGCSFLLGHVFFNWALKPHPWYPDYVAIPVIATLAAIVVCRLRDVYREDQQHWKLLMEIRDRIEAENRREANRA
jgi:hypothetical protein